MWLVDVAGGCGWCKWVEDVDGECEWWLWQVDVARFDSQIEQVAERVEVHIMQAPACNIHAHHAVHIMKCTS